LQNDIRHTLWDYAVQQSFAVYNQGLVHLAEVEAELKRKQEIPLPQGADDDEQYRASNRLALSRLKATLLSSHAKFEAAVQAAVPPKPTPSKPAQATAASGVYVRRARRGESDDAAALSDADRRAIAWQLALSAEKQAATKVRSYVPPSVSALPPGSVRVSGRASALLEVPGSAWCSACLCSRHPPPLTITNVPQTLTQATPLLATARSAPHASRHRLVRTIPVPSSARRGVG
jgi:hypothetical protein